MSDLGRHEIQTQSQAVYKEIGMFGDTQIALICWNKILVKMFFLRSS
jgi:hypothetical protein